MDCIGGLFGFIVVNRHIKNIDDSLAFSNSREKYDAEE